MMSIKPIIIKMNNLKEITSDLFANVIILQVSLFGIGNNFYNIIFTLSPN